MDDECCKVHRNFDTFHDTSRPGTIPVCTTRFMVFGTRQCSPSHCQYHQTVPSKKKGVCVQIEHPPFSQDLNPIDFFLFPRLKLALKGKDILDMQRNVTRLLNSFQKRLLAKIPGHV
ncbi:hypothetical protein TNCV_301511 [Trichonephila clavipes]|nr:hypothetical protein TNCV_301511 [Trichonephila clavipes]